MNDDVFKKEWKFAEKVIIDKDKEIARLNNIIDELRIKYNNLLEDNMRLRKEINLHSGKLVINELEVKTILN